MARPIKQGLDYFPLDVDFFHDEKIEAISGEFGIKGEIATIKLLCAIYRNGYYIVWSDMLKMKLLRNLQGISAELLETIVQRLVKWNFFNEELFNSEKVLTSTGIQKRYVEATKRRKDIEKLDYWLLNGVNVNKNTTTNGINVNINTQSKVNKSKLKEEVKEETPTTSEIQERIQSNMRRPIDEIFCELDKNELWKENMCMIYRIKGNTREIKLQNFDKILEMFYRHLTVELQEKEKSIRDTYSHFSNWIKKINLNAL
jgi:hypothetical protein